jgi:site-specific recombinase XerD
MFISEGHSDPASTSRIAFGKFNLDHSLPLREFERFFGIPARTGLDAWTSKYDSVERLLSHLARFSRSQDSRECYLNQLKRFCVATGYFSDQLVCLSQPAVEELIQGYVDCLAKQNASRSYLNTIIKRLRTFFHVNGYTDLKLHRYYQPTRYRRRDEYIPTKAEVHAMANASGSNRDRAIVLVLWSSGLRVSTFCALNYGDVSGEPYEHGESCVLLPVYPEMKTRVPAACKGEIPYYTFICPDALDAVKVYLLEREELYGRLEPEDPLFHSDWHLWKRSERSHRRLGRHLSQFFTVRPVLVVD